MSIRGTVTLECDRKNCHAEQVFEGEDFDFDVRKNRLFMEQCVDDWHMDEDGDLWCPQCLEEARHRDEDDGRTYADPRDEREDSRYG